MYELLTKKHPSLLAVSDGGYDKAKAVAPSVGYLALTRNSYWNAKASHEATQCKATARKGIVTSPYFRFLQITSSTWKFYHLTTYASLPTANYSLLKNEEAFAYELASEVLEDLRVADQPNAFNPLPTCRPYLRNYQGTSQAAKNARS
jgi:hypothetical protein